MALPRIRVQLVLRAPSEGGRATPATDSSQYRPHLVLEEPGALGHGTDLEDHFGVAFCGEGQLLEVGRLYELEVELIYHAYLDYSALSPGAAFTLREGSKIVGTGTVVGYSAG